MKMGAAYVPLDPAAPVQRIGYIIANCQMKAVVSTGQKMASLQEQLITQGIATSCARRPTATTPTWAVATTRSRAAVIASNWARSRQCCIATRTSKKRLSSPFPTMRLAIRSKPLWCCAMGKT
ncbi:MAG: hypothetical protein ACOYNY_08530 [Caldilineaceae bacterium]